MSFLLVSGVGLLFCGVAIAVFGASSFAEQRRTLARRLTASEILASPARDLRIILEDGFLKQFERAVTPKSEEERRKIRERLIRAGYRKPSAVRIYYASKSALGLAVSIGVAFAVVALGNSLPLWVDAALILSSALFGILAPSIWVERQFERRREAAEHGFPDTLDMLLVCIEAGLGVDQACRRVAEQVVSTCPVLAEEFSIVNDELLAGKERSDVFHDLGERTGVNDIRAFTTVLRHSIDYGVSIADTLRVYASEMRHKRVMRAEEKANVMPVKVALGSILFTIPPTMMILSGPSLIVLLRTFGVMHG